MRYLLYLTLLFNTSIIGQTNAKLKLKKFKVAAIEAPLYETSGLSYFQNKLYSINDGGNPNHLYTLDTIGKITKTTALPFTNTDWEAITCDNKTLYIGDFGNNTGNRKSFDIYKTDSLTNSASSPNKLSFNYQNQSENLIPYQHDFDCEAMIIHNNQLHLFTKGWQSNATTHYTIQLNQNDNQISTPLERFDIGYLVTDACIYYDKLYLIGYTRMGRCFLTLFQLDKGNTFFNQPLKKYRLGSVLKLGQIEGITATDRGLYITAEGIKKNFINIKPSLYFIPFSALKE